MIPPLLGSLKIKFARPYFDPAGAFSTLFKILVQLHFTTPFFDLKCSFRESNLVLSQHIAIAHCSRYLSAMRQIKCHTGQTRTKFFSSLHSFLYFLRRFPASLEVSEIILWSIFSFPARVIFHLFFLFSLFIFSSNILSHLQYQIFNSALCQH